MKILNAVIILSALTTPATVGAQVFLSGEKLQTLCEVGAAEAYVMGVMDTNNALSSLGLGGAPLCSPAWFTSGNATNITCDYLASGDNPLDQPAAGLVIIALAEALPCG